MSGTPPPSLMVIHGASGDLSHRKLLPALRSIAAAEEDPWAGRILGVGRSERTDEAFREEAAEALAEAGFDDEADRNWCLERLDWQAAAGDEGDFGRLRRRIEEIEAEHDLPGGRVFYLALPPHAFAPTIERLGGAGLHDGPAWTRLVIEKPVGHDVESARALNETAHRWFREEQIYRIDHYLGKETVQNLLVFRFANSVFESLWNRDRVSDVQITVAEEIGVEDRAGYYDEVGALRDMVQNHLTQLLTLLAMDVPVSYDADAVRYEKIKVLRAVSPIDPDDVVFGQYGPGGTDGDRLRGYLQEEDVPEGSDTETFVALRLEIDSWRWQGVPFYLRTGKRLPRRLTQVVVRFRRPPVALFDSLGCCPTHPNALVLTLQPDEGFALCVDVKRPGEPFELQTLPLHFLYREAFGPIPDAYETLLRDVLTGDQTLFVHAEETEAAWALYTPLLESPIPVRSYPAGCWGPSEAEALLEADGHAWQGPLDHGELHALGAPAHPDR